MRERLAPANLEDDAHASRVGVLIVSRTDAGLDSHRRNQPLAAELLGVQNAYALPEGPNRLSFHAVKLWPLPLIAQGRNTK